MCVMYSKLQGLENLLNLFQLLNCHKELCQTDDIHQISPIQQIYTLSFPFLLQQKSITRDGEHTSTEMGTLILEFLSQLAFNPTQPQDCIKENKDVSRNENLPVRQPQTLVLSKYPAFQEEEKGTRTKARCITVG